VNHNAILQIAPYIRDRLIRSLETGLAPFPCTAAGLRSALGGVELEQISIDAINSVAKFGLNGIGTAAWIRSISEASKATPGPALVWSGPEVPGVHTRRTRQVYQELFSTFKHSLWLSSFVYFDGSSAFEMLANRLDHNPSLEVCLFLNIQRKKHDTCSPTELVRRFTDQFWTKDWPGINRPRVFYDPRSLIMDTTSSVLHAKAVVADSEVVFVTSANMTDAAFDRNYELGILSHDRELAASVGRHFQILVEKNLLHPLPTQ